MKSVKYYLNKKAKLISFLIIAICSCTHLTAQETPVKDQDSTKTTYSFANLSLPNPDSIVSKYEYDPETDRYIYSEALGDFNINYPIILTPKQFQELIDKENLKNYYKEKIEAFEGKTEEAKEKQKNLLPEFYVKSGLFETIFGGDKIEFIPQGSVEVDLGVLFTKQDNPSFSPQNRSNFTFDFDQRISLSLLGKVGTRLQVNANFDTQSTFDFQNLIKLEYNPTLGGGEDSILQKLEVGNVSMPLNTSLITGAQSLFGVKTELQFGKTRVTGVFSEQRSDSRSVTAQGGGTVDEFEFFARDYDENRHYFLSQYFKENYDKALANYPFINSNVQITRIEVWVTNRTNRTENVRNLVALQDIGESEETNVINIDSGVSNVPNAYPDNKNNALNPANIGGAGSQLNNNIREIVTADTGFNYNVNEGTDYAKLENARQLQQNQDYILSTQLGYISLNQRLNNDEVLGVAFQFTVGGTVYQVGEFANDGVNATDVETNTEGQVITVTNKALVVKMLKSSVTNTSNPVWDLMMKNIYDTGAYQLSSDDFRLNIFYNEASALNYIKPVSGTTFPLFDINNTPGNSSDDVVISELTLLKLFNFDRLNSNNDPQTNGDGFFDFVPGLTVIPQNGKIVFTKAEPFGRYLFDVLDDDGVPSDNKSDYNNDNFNDNQSKYVYDILYKSTKTAALDEASKNKFLLKGRYKSEAGDGIPIGGFNIPRGSVKVTAGGRVLVEGVDYSVNYQLGRVNIIDPALKASNTPIEVSTENNSIFGQQTKRFTGINVEHQFNKNFLLGATFVNLNERPITQKANYNTEPINNTILGFNGNYSTEVPFFTRLANKLPNVDTDVESNLSVRGEFAYLLPGSPKGTDFAGEATSYIDDFEGSQSGIDLKSPLAWNLSSRPLELNGTTVFDDIGIENGYGRALLNWYDIDQIFYSGNRPSGISDEDVSGSFTSRAFIEEINTQQIAQGQTAVLNTLNLTYYPEERGPYNFEPGAENGILSNPNNSWAGITRRVTTSDFEQSNVEYIEFWLQDPFSENSTSLGGELSIHLGNISEDILKDGRKQFENGLPKDGNISLLPKTDFVSVVPQNQSLIYAFDSTGEERTNQDVGLDGYDDAEELTFFPPGFDKEDPAADNYTYYLNTEGNILERYKGYNGLEGNSPDAFSDTNRGSGANPDTEDVNQDNTMNTIDSYFEYNIKISPTDLQSNTNPFIVDRKSNTRFTPDGSNPTITWYQFRIPVQGDHVNAINGISDFRSIRFARLVLKKFTEQTTLRFGTLDLVRSDWRRFNLPLNASNTPTDADFSIGVVSSQINNGDYVSPPGVVPEQVNNNNTIIDQNEQALVVSACGLDVQDSRGVYKNLDIDMRQYKKVRMFMHANSIVGNTDLGDGDMVGFIRLGNDLNDNYYQIELPLTVSNQSNTTAEDYWPLENEINLPLSVLEEVKALNIGNSSLEATFYDIIDGELTEIVNQFDDYDVPGRDKHRVAIKGNPNFGAIRNLMVGVKNVTTGEICGDAWFNELRLSELDNKGGWAAILGMDTNFGDFANVSASGRISTAGFGAIDQGPNERSREDIKQYDVVTNVNMGQLLPKKWGIQVPFNYGEAVEVITPEYDQQFKDIPLKTRINNAETSEEREQIRKQSEDFTKRQSINFIGVKKNRTGESKPRFYDVENLTFNYSYNKEIHRDFEIENSENKILRTGVNYAYNFQPFSIEPFKKKDSLFTGKYWKLLKEFNFNPIPTTVALNTDVNRQFNRQKFRDLELGAGNIQLEELFRRNYTFDFQYNLNWNLTKSLSVNFAASNNNIIRNYFKEGLISGEQDPTLDIWDGLLDFGDPNFQSQNLGVNYEIPINKIPTFSFLKASYSYQGTFQWQKGSDLFGDIIASDGVSYDLGNSISNGSTHNINSSLDMTKLYKHLGLKKARITNNKLKASPKALAIPEPKNNTYKTAKTKSKIKKQKGSKFGNFGIGLLTSIKRIQVNYSQNNGTYLPGYLNTPGFIGTLKPTLAYTFGGQGDVRNLAARNGWLTQFPEFNQQYTVSQTRQLDVSASLEPFNDFKIDVIGNRTYANNFSENYIVKDLENDGTLEYQSLTPNAFGNYSISVFTLPTAFGTSDENGSQAFEKFRANRLIIANRLASEKGIDVTNPDNLDAEGYPKGFGKNSQAVLLPSFTSAYSGQNAKKSNLGTFKDLPLPNWDIKYSGLMKLKWFKKRFKRFSLTHGYRSTYTISQFRNNLNYEAVDYNVEYESQPRETIDQSGNYKNETLFGNVTIAELFTPLIRVDFEMKNSIKVLLELKKDRLLSLSFDNNLLTEISGNEYTLGLGYRIKDVMIKSKLAGPRKKIVSDLNLKADVSVRNNKTIVRYLDFDNNQITNGQTIWGARFNADYAFSKNLTGIFYFDYTFSEFAISTAFPQTTIRSGITIRYNFGN